jgi:hypothetical protein
LQETQELLAKEKPGGRHKEDFETTYLPQLLKAIIGQK